MEGPPPCWRRLMTPRPRPPTAHWGRGADEADGAEAGGLDGRAEEAERPEPFPAVIQCLIEHRKAGSQFLIFIWVLYLRRVVPSQSAPCRAPCRAPRQSPCPYLARSHLMPPSKSGWRRRAFPPRSQEAPCELFSACFSPSCCFGVFEQSSRGTAGPRRCQDPPLCPRGGARGATTPTKTVRG